MDLSVFWKGALLGFSIAAPVGPIGTLCTAAFGALGLLTRVAAAALVAGVFAGSAAWWLLLAGATSRLRGRLPPNALAWINRGSGLILGAFGALALAAAWAS
jgi:arginine exporter protein ArgO